MFSSGEPGFRLCEGPVGYSYYSSAVTSSLSAELVFTTINTSCRNQLTMQGQMGGPGSPDNGWTPLPLKNPDLPLLTVQDALFSTE